MVLVTAFEPFGGAPVNASAEIARRWAREEDTVRVACLPVVRGEAERAGLAAWDTAAASLWLALGELRREDGCDGPIRLEKVAINWDDFRIPDNAGQQPRNRPIRPDGPDAYFSSLPIAEIVAALDGKTPVPIRLSLSAGAFLCNHLAYVVRDSRPTVPFGFLHVPAWRPEDGESRLAALVASVQAVYSEVLAIYSR